ncbi:MAG: hypothetical protein M1819_005156 [Sarea resinae]|nr:MAG: hypothetical protein M1819_005156 [Sarea resinae]
MSTEAVINPTGQAPSKGKKKRAKAEGSASSPSAAPSTPTIDAPISNGVADHPTTAEGADTSYESPYIRELYKNIRNVNKKLNATQKVDSIIAENPGKTLDDLVASRKINNDQKAQALKKPSLQASLAQLEDQIAQYKKFDQEYQNRIVAEKAALETAHKQELETLANAVRSEVKAEAQKEARERLLVLSKFLRAAAAKRQMGEENTDEGKAFEGVLLLVYGGDASAVAAAEKLIDGTDDEVTGTDEKPLPITFGQVRQSSLDHAPYAAEEAWAEDVAQSEPAPPTNADPEDSTPSLSVPPATDPTLANAGLTETNIDPEPVNSEPETEGIQAPEQSGIDSGAANAAAENQWDAKMSASVESGPEGWIEVPRDLAETETGLAGIPANNTSTQSWADDHPTESVPVAPESAAAPTITGNDGFHEVHHSRGGRGRGGFQGEHRGGYRGRGGHRGGEGSGYRGRGGSRGDRGDRGGEGGHRGRGRGGFRGGRGRETPQ